MGLVYHKGLVNKSVINENSLTWVMLAEYIKAVLKQFLNQKKGKNK